MAGVKWIVANAAKLGIDASRIIVAGVPLRSGTGRQRVVAADDSGIDEQEQPSIKAETAVVVLLCAGDKDSQERDIQRAKRLAQDWR